MKAWGLSDVGNVRDVNQDTFRLKFIGGEEQGIFLVCDGMGGAKAGEVASRLAAEAFLQFMDGQWSGSCTEERIRAAYNRVNETVYDMAQSDPDYAGMGTTMVTAVCADGRVLVGNVGDSRAYLLDENGARQITEDHSLVSELMKRGDLTPYQASHHPSRNVITRAIGADATVKCDVFPLKVKTGQYLLLCSDGLIRDVTDPEIYYQIYQCDHPETACDRLMALAKSRGGRDNITLLLVAF